MARLALSRIAAVAVIGAGIAAGATAVTIAAGGPDWIVYAVALLACALGTMQILAPGSGLPPLRRWKREPQAEEEPRFQPATGAPRVHR